MIKSGFSKVGFVDNYDRSLWKPPTYVSNCSICGHQTNFFIRPLHEKNNSLTDFEELILWKTKNNNVWGIHKPCGQQRGEGVPEKTISVHKKGGGVRGWSTWTIFFNILQN